MTGPDSPGGLLVPRALRVPRPQSKSNWGPAFDGSFREQSHLRLALESQSQTCNLRGRCPGNPGRVGYELQDDESCRNETL
jgi:hypothetical protein